jgi:hypothetical protein
MLYYGILCSLSYMLYYRIPCSLCRVLYAICCIYVLVLHNLCLGVVE